MDSDEQRKSESGILGEAANGQAGPARSIRLSRGRKAIVPPSPVPIEVYLARDKQGRAVVRFVGTDSVTTAAIPIEKP
jgi:hypothetical protein